MEMAFLPPVEFCKPSRVGLVALLLVGGLACGKEEITRYQVKGEPTGAPSKPTATPEPMPMGHPVAGGGLAWTLPKGWKEERSGGMRFATLKPPVPGRIDGSVVVLPGTAGGELANVNRWRGQIALPPVDEAGLTALRKRASSPAGPLAWFDLVSQDGKTRMVVGLLSTADGRTWFLKLTGDSDPVVKSRSDFVHLMESLRLGQSN